MVSKALGYTGRYCAPLLIARRLKERVMDIRKTHLEKPWPPDDREVGVVLVAHSMG